MSGLIVGIGLFPCWFVWTVPKVQRFYVVSYVKAAIKQLPATLRGHLGLKVQVHTNNRAAKEYVQVLYSGKNPVGLKSKNLATESLYVRAMSVWAGEWYAWLKKWVYPDGYGEIFQRPAVLGLGALLCLVMLGRFLDRGRQGRAREGVHERGTRFMPSVRAFNREVLKGGLTPGITLTVGKPFGVWPQRVVIPRELEAYHFAICAATGSGKSTLILEMCDQIEKRGETAIIYDPKGEYRDRFYSEERGDIILDPTDERCPYWAIEEEARDEAEATPWGMAFWPDVPGEFRIWPKHAREQFGYLLHTFSIYNATKDWATCANLARWLAHPEQMIAPLLKGSEHAIAISSNAKEQAQAHWTHLAEAAKPLRMMPATPEGRQRFSVREYSKKRQGWIYMTSRPLTVDALLPLHSAMMDMLILSNQTPGDKDCLKAWFIIEEAATMQNLPQLESGMTKQRASGNPMVLGFHDLAQLKKRYGEDGATTITSQAYTNIMLRSGAPQAAKHCELMIGHEDSRRIQENMPVHIVGHHNRGRSWSEQPVTRPVVMAAEIQELPRFHGYLLYQGMVLPIKVQKQKERIRTRRIERILPSTRREPLMDVNIPDTDQVIPVKEEPAPVAVGAVTGGVEAKSPEPKSVGVRRRKRFE